MYNGNEAEARIFTVDTRFQKVARRPGGVPRERAIAQAQANIEEAKPEFDEWFDRELEALAGILNSAKSASPPATGLEPQIRGFVSCATADLSSVSSLLPSSRIPYAKSLFRLN